MIGSWEAFGIVIAAVVLDMLFRWVAFRHLESAAIDLAVFSCVYSAVELLRSQSVEGLDSEHTEYWGTRVLIGILIVVVLVGLHALLREKLSEHIEDTLRRRHDDAHGDEIHRALAALTPMLKSVTLLTFAEPTGRTAVIRGGKVRRRQEVVDVANMLLQQSQPAGGNLAQFELAQTDLVLDAPVRRAALLAFAVFGASAVIVPIISTSTLESISESLQFWS